MIDEDDISAARILIIDDQIDNIELLSDMLSLAGYRYIFGLSDPREAVGCYDMYRPDIILLDLLMPGLSGYQVLELLASRISAETFLPVLILTAETSAQLQQRVIAAGATDYLTKPFNIAEVTARIRNLLKIRFLRLALQRQHTQIAETINERTYELRSAHVEMAERLARAAEYRDDTTGQHTRRVGVLAALVAHELGMPAADVELMQLAAPLHDLGKIGIRDAILLKPDRLSPDEFAAIREHTHIGASLMSEGQSALLQYAERIAMTHHERWDGSGYPAGLRGEQIPIEGRIVAVVDVFDALTHRRSYKEAWSTADACAEIANQSGKQFDPRVVEAFLRIVGLVAEM
jgi:putative two-component system response regulator